MTKWPKVELDYKDPFHKKCKQPEYPNKFVSWTMEKFHLELVLSGKCYQEIFEPSKQTLFHCLN